MAAEPLLPPNQPQGATKPSPFFAEVEKVELEVKADADEVFADAERDARQAEAEAVKLLDEIEHKAPPAEPTPTPPAATEVPAP